MTLLLLYHTLYLHTPHIFLYRTSLPFVTYIRLVCLVVLLHLVGGSNRGAISD